jgi:hypothetical protein
MHVHKQILEIEQTSLYAEMIPILPPVIKRRTLKPQLIKASKKKCLVCWTASGHTCEARQPSTKLKPHNQGQEKSPNKRVRRT